jgi:hypothetical protein
MIAFLCYTFLFDLLKISWETRLRDGIGPRVSSLRVFKPLLKRLPSTWVEQLVLLAEARDEKFLQSRSKFAVN